MAHGKATQIPQVLTNSAVVAEVLGVSRRRVSQLATEQVLPAPVNHKYDALECALRYIKFQRKNSEQQGGGSSTAELKKSRADLLKTQRKNAELAYLEKTGQMLNIDDVEAIIIEGAAVFAGQKRSMGSRLDGKLANMHDSKTILKLLNAENDGILEGVADKFQSLADRANS